ncbi:MAG: hypothetical protein K2J91_03005, partial [Lachnospiraceae bacterium]|nr:hypothetical protein [Lachnospiraceae bacterium]
MSKLDDNKGVSHDTSEIKEIILDIEDSYKKNDSIEEENVDFTLDISDILEDEEKEKKKKKRRNVCKIFLIAAEMFVILVTSFMLFLLVTPNSKAMLASSWLGRIFIKFIVSDEDYNNILDTDYDRNNMNANEGVDTDVLENYTNIALFGLDSRYGELDQGVR